MKLARRKFVHLAAGAVAVCATVALKPAWSQNASPAVAPSRNAAQSPASIPDLSGIWGH